DLRGGGASGDAVDVELHLRGVLRIHGERGPAAEAGGFAAEDERSVVGEHGVEAKSGAGEEEENGEKEAFHRAERGEARADTTEDAGAKGEVLETRKKRLNEK